MPANLRISSLIPAGLIVDSVTQDGDTIVVTAHAGVQKATCPLCGSPSPRVHSRYVRRVSDLPCSGRGVRLRVVARRFCCMVPHCRRRIFAERFDETMLAERSRRTNRLDCVVHHLGLALGGRPAASFARRLMLPVSNDTFLRVVRRRARPRTEPLNVVGVDDWAFRRNHRYGTIVCDLERRRVVTLLPDREVTTVQAWLADHQGDVTGQPCAISTVNCAAHHYVVRCNVAVHLQSSLGVSSLDFGHLSQTRAASFIKGTQIMSARMELALASVGMTLTALLALGALFFE
jgi:hypothetical protein